MSRIAVIGNAGGGKTTLSHRMGRLLGLPVISMDQLTWRPGWRRAPDEEIEAAHAAALARGRWIVDGFGTWEQIERRFRAADTIVFVDFAFWRHCWWAGKRQLASLFRAREHFPSDCPMLPKTFELYRRMWRIHRHWRPRLERLLAEHAVGRRVVRIETPREMASLLAECESLTAS